MLKYYSAKEVKSPKDLISDVEELYDGGPHKGQYSVAKIKWKGETCVGIRWNVTERELTNIDKATGKIICKGEPNSRGYPTWFILPEEFLKQIIIGGQLADKLRKVIDDNIE